jgi:hypothetical protein
MSRGLGVSVLTAIMMFVTACGPKTGMHGSPATWELRGRVEAISGSRLEVRHKSGRIVPLQIDGGTEFVGDGGRNVRGAVTAGMRVTVRVETEPSGGYRARAVRVFN